MRVFALGFPLRRRIAIAILDGGAGASARLGTAAEVFQLLENGRGLGGGVAGGAPEAFEVFALTLKVGGDGVYVAAW